MAGRKVTVFALISSASPPRLLCQGHQRLRSIGISTGAAGRFLRWASISWSSFSKRATTAAASSGRPSRASLTVVMTTRLSHSSSEIPGRLSHSFSTESDCPFSSGPRQGEELKLR